MSVSGEKAVSIGVKKLPVSDEKVVSIYGDGNHIHYQVRRWSVSGEKVVSIRVKKLPVSGEQVVSI